LVGRIECAAAKPSVPRPTVAVMIDPEEPASPVRVRTPSELAREEALRVVYQEIAELEAADAAVRAGLSARARRNESSVVYSIRLDPGEVRALEARAAARGIKPSILARNLVRCGLQEDPDLRLAAALDRFESALGELRDATRQRKWIYP